jgi:hypothetical protein
MAGNGRVGRGSSIPLLGDYDRDLKRGCFARYRFVMSFTDDKIEGLDVRKGI